MPFLRPITAALLCLLLPTAIGHAEEFGDEIPTVLAPVRLSQPRTEVPASVTVLDREFIQASGVRELAQLFRYVPGVAVGARDGWNYTVSYHGTTYRDSRRMQVLVDGRSVYQAGLATIDWNDIPLAIEEIERIEVVRGPNTAAYGANAFLGIINIITRHPDDSPRLRLKATAGTESVEDYYGSVAGRIGEVSYRVSAGERHDAGFDRKADGRDRRDSKNLQHINGRWSLSPTENWNLQLNAGYKNGVYIEDLPDADVIVPGLPPLTWETSPDIRSKDYFLTLESEHFLSGRDSFNWQVDFSRQRDKVEWRTCLPALFLGFPDTRVVCGYANENSVNQRIDIDLQHTLIGEAPWKLVYGVHAKIAEVDSQTFFGGDVRRESYQLFANAEYRFLRLWSITLGGSQEYHSTQEESFSPRIALLFFPIDDHTLRTVWSRAVRTPDLFETEADWTYTARDLRFRNGTPYAATSGLFQHRAVAPKGLHEEEIESIEFGYYGLWLDRRLEIDIKWFWDKLDELISKKLVFTNFTSTNNGWLDQQGYEGELNFRFTPALRLRTTYALIHDESNQNSEMEMTPRHSGSAALIYRLRDWQLSSTYYLADKVGYRRFEQLDFRIARNITVGDSNVELAATVQHLYHYNEGDLFNDNRYDDPYRFWLSLDVQF
jgi:iron complex outermembrane receptor protein